MCVAPANVCCGVFLGVCVFFCAFFCAFFLTMEEGYRVDWGSIERGVGVITVGGMLFGTVVGLARHNGSAALRGALLGGGQCAVFAASYYGVREGYRHLLGVSSWRQEWFTINVVR